MAYTILMLGQDFGKTRMRARLFRALGHEIIFIRNTIADYQPGINTHPTLLDRVAHRLKRPLDHFSINQALLDRVTQQHFDLLWVEYCPELRSSTLRRVKQLLPNLKMVMHTEDDIFLAHNRSYYMTAAIPEYDMIFTTKSYHVEVLPGLGAKAVVYHHKGFDPLFHHPVSVSESERAQYGADVGFIGTFEADRAQKLLFLAKHHIAVRVWGNGWAEWVNKHPQLQVENKPLYDADYQKAICATKINLAFLRKRNQDLHTDRSIEIPACGAFMLAERSEEHTSLFEENYEAVFFDISNQNELLEKVTYYLQDEMARTVIQKRGRDCCIQKKYDYQTILKKQLECLSLG